MNMIQDTNDCHWRLPCGVCRLTMTDCVKANPITWTAVPTWVSTNCEANMTANEKEVTE